MTRCYYCAAELPDNELYHEVCSKKFFGSARPPLLEYRLADLTELAKKLVLLHGAVPGVQPKLSLHLNKQRQGGRLTLVGLWGEYILKPPSPQYLQLPENEFLTMKLANIFGIKTASCSLIKLASGETAYIVKRMDRDQDKKIHMEDFCQLSGMLTEDKYKSSLENCIKIIKKFSANPLLDCLNFFELILFCYFTGNNDMHLKNFSLIMSGGIIQLAPAYDLLNVALAIPEQIDNEESALTMNGKKRNFNSNDFLVFAEYCGINKKQLANIFFKFKNNSTKAEAFINNSFLEKSLKVRYLELFLTRTEKILN